MQNMPVIQLPKHFYEWQQPTAALLDWIDRQLPAGLPPSARRGALSRVRAALGSNFWITLMRDFENRPFTPEEEEKVRFKLFRTACNEAARCVTGSEGMAEVDRWRYRVWRTENGQDLYKENPEYEFNAIYDMRKLWFEFQLQLERTTLPEDWVAEQAKTYEDCLNLRYAAPHWRWDPGTFTFLEISDSKLLDGKGAEQPNPQTLRGLIDRYAR